MSAARCGERVGHRDVDQHGVERARGVDLLGEVVGRLRQPEPADDLLGDPRARHQLDVGRHPLLRELRALVGALGVSAVCAETYIVSRRCTPSAAGTRPRRRRRARPGPARRTIGQRSRKILQVVACRVTSSASGSGCGRSDAGPSSRHRRRACRRGGRGVGGDAVVAQRRPQLGGRGWCRGTPPTARPRRPNAATGARTKVMSAGSRPLQVRGEPAQAAVAQRVVDADRPARGVEQLVACRPGWTACPARRPG